jgi:excisionase family DNA binding protein
VTATTRYRTGASRTADETAAAGGLRITITDADGREADAPEQVYRIAREALSLAREGRSAALVSYDQDLTTQEAADMLGVSRPHLVKMLEAGELPYYLVGKHRRLAFSDVIEYKRARDSRRRTALAELTADSQDLELY